MKRKSIIILIAATTLQSGLGGVAALLAGNPAPAETEPAPILIASNPEPAPVPIPIPLPEPSSGPSDGTNGNSWGG